jgi:hypothetical protein
MRLLQAIGALQAGHYRSKMVGLIGFGALILFFDIVWPSVASAQAPTPTPVPSACFTSTNEVLMPSGDSWLLTVDLKLLDPEKVLDNARSGQAAGDPGQGEHKFSVSWSGVAVPPSRLEVLAPEPVVPQHINILVDLEHPVTVAGETNTSEKEGKFWTRLVWEEILPEIKMDANTTYTTTVFCNCMYGTLGPGNPLGPTGDEAKDPEEVFKRVIDVLGYARDDSATGQYRPTPIPHQQGMPNVNVIIRWRAEDQDILATNPGLDSKVALNMLTNIVGSYSADLKDRDRAIVIVLSRLANLDPATFEKARTNLFDEVHWQDNRLHAFYVTMADPDFAPLRSELLLTANLRLQIRSQVVLAQPYASQASVIISYPGCLDISVPLLPLDANEVADTTKAMPGAFRWMMYLMLGTAMAAVILGTGLTLFRYNNTIHSELENLFDAEDGHDKT